ncbi:MAG: DUF1015 domain-containing protein [Clostridia bacterium]|nr:DUF1015 domain-containing protein [Clostridia bacterium]
MDSIKTIVRSPVLYPKKGMDMRAWSVIACDQYTSDALYWENVESEVGDKPSTLRLILPEIYLRDAKSRIPAINAKMREYVEGDIFDETDGLILVERTTQSGTRRGILLTIDLEDFSYEKGAKTPVRSTEGTILERIPPRAEIRRDAPLELPHVMVLYDDKEGAVLRTVKKGETMYDFDLNMGGGHVKGTKIENSDEVIKAFYALADPNRQKELYGTDDKFLFAVGDGNHSLAAAKAHWEAVKTNLSPEKASSHPARYALVEAVNIYDGALKFEPIHRFVKCRNPQRLQSMLGLSGGRKCRTVIDGNIRETAFPDYIPEGIAETDRVISEFVQKFGGEVDYVHGEDEVIALSSDGIGVMFPPIKKDDFFRTIAEGGNLPRKTFSMGEGNEKRYYIEARKIR